MGLKNTIVMYRMARLAVAATMGMA